jgi:hypothetical protein
MPTTIVLGGLGSASLSLVSAIASAHSLVGHKRHLAHFCGTSARNYLSEPISGTNPVRAGFWNQEHVEWLIGTFWR